MKYLKKFNESNIDIPTYFNLGLIKEIFTDISDKYNVEIQYDQSSKSSFVVSKLDPMAWCRINSLDNNSILKDNIEKAINRALSHYYDETGIELTAFITNSNYGHFFKNEVWHLIIYFIRHDQIDKIMHSLKSDYDSFTKCSKIYNLQTSLNESIDNEFFSQEEVDDIIDIFRDMVIDELDLSPNQYPGTIRSIRENEYAISNSPRDFITIYLKSFDKVKSKIIIKDFIKRLNMMNKYEVNYQNHNITTIIEIIKKDNPAGTDGSYPIVITESIDQLLEDSDINDIKDIFQDIIDEHNMIERRETGNYNEVEYEFTEKFLWFKIVIYSRIQGEKIMKFENEEKLLKDTSDFRKRLDAMGFDSVENYEYTSSDLGKLFIDIIRIKIKRK